MGVSSSDGEVFVASVAAPPVFAVIFDRHVDAVRLYVERRLGSVRADDVVSESFRVAFERRADFDASAVSALPWLYGIAGNLVRNERRAHERRLRALVRLAGRRSVGIDPLLDVASRVDADRTLEALGSALLELSEPEREVLLLVAWEQMSPVEVALVLGVPSATVRTRLYRARQSIRDFVSDSGDPREVVNDAR